MDGLVPFFILLGIVVLLYILGLYSYHKCPKGGWHNPRESAENEQGFEVKICQKCGKEMLDTKSSMYSGFSDNHDMPI